MERINRPCREHNRPLVATNSSKAKDSPRHRQGRWEEETGPVVVYGQPFTSDRRDESQREALVPLLCPHIHTSDTNSVLPLGGPFTSTSSRGHTSGNALFCHLCCQNRRQWYKPDLKKLNQNAAENFSPTGYLVEDLKVAVPQQRSLLGRHCWARTHVQIWYYHNWTQSGPERGLRTQKKGALFTCLCTVSRFLLFYQCSPLSGLH